MFSILSTQWAESETEQRPKCDFAMKNCQVESSQHTLRVPPFSGEPALSLQDLTWWKWDDWTHTLSHPFTPNFCSFTSFGKAEGQSEGTLAPISLFHYFQLATWIISPKSPGHLCLQLPFALKVPGFKETVCRGETPQLFWRHQHVGQKSCTSYGEHPRDGNAVLLPISSDWIDLIHQQYPTWKNVLDLQNHFVWLADSSSFLFSVWTFRLGPKWLFRTDDLLVGHCIAEDHATCSQSNRWWSETCPSNWEEDQVCQELQAER